MSTTTTGQIASYRNFMGLAPNSLSRAMQYFVDFGANGPSQSLNLTEMIQENFLEFVQGMYVDNTLNNAAVVVKFNILGQSFYFPGGSSGYIPVLAPNPPIISFYSAGSGGTNFFFMNHPAPAFTMPTMPQWGTPYTATVTAAGNTPIISPATNQTFFITGGTISISGNATLAAAGELTVSLLDGATVIARQVIYIPAAAINTPASVIWSAPFGVYNSAVYGQNLIVNLSSALLTGKLSINITGGVQPYKVG